MVGGVVGILYFPLHSLAYFASEGGSEGVVNSADAGRELLAPLLDWSSADTVYRTYGKVYLVVVLGFRLGLIALRGRRDGEADGLERWTFRVALAGYALLVVGAVVEYWTPYLDFGFLAFYRAGRSSCTRRFDPARHRAAARRCRAAHGRLAAHGLDAARLRANRAARPSERGTRVSRSGLDRARLVALVGDAGWQPGPSRPLGEQVSRRTTAAVSCRWGACA